MPKRRSEPLPSKYSPSPEFITNEAVGKLTVSWSGDEEVQSSISTEIFLADREVHRKLEVNEPVDNPLGLTYTIAQRALYSQYNRPYKKHEVTNIDFNKLTNTSPSAEEIFLAKERSNALAGVILTLTKEEQLLVGLRFVEGMPLEKVAPVLNISLGAVKMRVGRVVKKLQAKMGGLGFL